MSGLLAALLFLGSLGILALSNRIFKSIFSPFGIYGFVWLFTFGAYSLEWVYYVAVDVGTWILLGAAFIAFMFGAALVALRQSRGEADFDTERVRWADRINKSRFEKWLLLISIAGLLGFYFYLQTINDLFGLDAFVYAPAAIRIAQSSSSFSDRFGSLQYLLLHLNMLIVALSVAYFTIFGISKRNWWVCLLALAGFFTTLFTEARTQFFAALLLAAFVRIYLKPPRSLNFRLIASGLILVGLLLGFFNYIAQSLGKTESLTDASGNMPSELSFLTDTYIYLTGPIPTLQSYMRDTNDLTFGLNTILPVTKVLARIFPEIQVPPENTTTYFVPYGLNATTFLGVFYQDWGTAGLIFAPFLLGLVSTVLFFRMRRAPTLWLVLLNSLMAYCLVYSVINSRFITTYIWEFAIVGYFLARSVSSPSRAYTKMPVPQAVSAVSSYAANRRINVWREVKHE